MTKGRRKKTSGHSVDTRPASRLAVSSQSPDDVSDLVRDLGALIVSTRRGVAVTANTSLTTLYWQIGMRVHREILQSRRAEYGSEIVSAVGRQLQVGCRPKRSDNRDCVRRADAGR